MERLQKVKKKDTLGSLGCLPEIRHGHFKSLQYRPANRHKQQNLRKFFSYQRRQTNGEAYCVHELEDST